MNAKKLFLLCIVFLLAAVAAACAAAPSPHETVVETVVAQVEAEGETTLQVVTATPLPSSEEPIAGHPAEEAASVPPYATPAPIATYPAGSTPASQDGGFQDYGFNPYVDPRTDPLSTFAIDVDTAAYAIARKYIEGGQLPPPEAIRPEEFINYFEQGYAAPPDAAFALFADGAPSPFHTDGTHFLRFGIQGQDIPAQTRQPANIVIVIDLSGSMNENNKLWLAQESLHLLVENLYPRDEIAIVAYNNFAWVEMEPISARNKTRIGSVIDSLWADNSTNAEAGLILGYDMMGQMFDASETNRVVLVSDGVANVGETGPQGILARIAESVESGITLTTVGVGLGNYNDVLLEQLADNGDGNYYYVDTLDEAEKVFVEDIAGTLQVIAYDAKVQVDFNPDVVAQYRLIGYENRAVADEDFRDDNVDAGEIGAGHTVTAVYAVQFRPGAQGRIATMHLRWQEPLTFQPVEIIGDVTTAHLAGSFEQASPHLQLDVIVSQYAEVLGRSPWSQGITFEWLAQHAFRIAELLPGDVDVSEFAQLVARAAGLDE
jgi:Ca-activated chloride channel family protein